LRAGRKALLESLLPELEIELPETPGSLDPAALFAAPIEDVWLEVGFGTGEHLEAQAEAHPRVGFIGCEPFINGVARLLVLIADQGLDNIRVFTDDAGLVLEALEEASLGRVFVLFPDPWPKTRHHKRRFISGATVDDLARVMKDGADLRVATDHPEYCRWILARLLRHGAFEWLAEGPADWRSRPSDWPSTRYEEKARAAGTQGAYLSFRRRQRA
jgi:tRNA (guanine-N7-)-methyltransferase